MATANVGRVPEGPQEHAARIAVAMHACQREDSLYCLAVAAGASEEQAACADYLHDVLDQLARIGLTNVATHYRPAGTDGAHIFGLEDLDFQKTLDQEGSSDGE